MCDWCFKQLTVSAGDNRWDEPVNTARTRVVTVAELESVKVGDELAHWDVERTDEAKFREQQVCNLHSVITQRRSQAN